MLVPTQARQPRPRGRDPNLVLSPRVLTFTSGSAQSYTHNGYSLMISSLGVKEQLAVIAKLPMTLYIERDWVAACTQRLLPIADQYTLPTALAHSISLIWVFTITDRAQLGSIHLLVQCDYVAHG